VVKNPALGKVLKTDPNKAGKDFLNARSRGLLHDVCPATKAAITKKTIPC
jgi:hypothetical protein